MLYRQHIFRPKDLLEPLEVLLDFTTNNQIFHDFEASGSFEGKLDFEILSQAQWYEKL